MSSIDVGAIATNAIIITASVFIPIIGTQAVLLLKKCLKKRGIEIDQVQSDRLQGMVVNGLNGAAAIAEAKTSMLSPIEIKNQSLAGTIDYVKAHGLDTLKSLGFNPADPKQQAALADVIRARIETAINDPKAPTPPAITPAEVKAAPVIITQ